MPAIPCPNCGADVPFRTAALPARTCGACRSIVMRYENGAQTLGITAELPFDISPVRVGTRGQWDGAAFELVGRVRWSWEDGAWNEWQMALDDGRLLWLAEAMGQFAVLRERPLAGKLANVLTRLIKGEYVSIGETAQIDGTGYEVADQRKVQCIGCEGELPFSAPTGWAMRSVDLKTRDGKLASFQSDGREHFLYVGEPVVLARLKPSGLRVLPGWSLPAYAA